jgi:hypothetical protein
MKLIPDIVFDGNRSPPCNRKAVRSRLEFGKQELNPEQLEHGNAPQGALSIGEDPELST